MLQTLRHDEAKRVDRGELVERRAFFCWDDAKMQEGGLLPTRLQRGRAASGAEDQGDVPDAGEGRARRARHPPAWMMS